MPARSLNSRLADQALDGFDAREVRLLRRLKSPAGVQRLLDSFPYHDADTCWAPRRVLREGVAHCLEGAMLAAAAMRELGYPPLIVDLEGEQDTDHVIAVYRAGRYWGSIAKSHFNGLRDRPPIFRSLRELAISYFDDYFNLRRERSLRTYSQPVDLSRFDHLSWTTSERPNWFVPEHLLKIRHTPLISKAQARALYRVDQLALRASLLDNEAPLL